MPPTSKKSYRKRAFKLVTPPFASCLKKDFRRRKPVKVVAIGSVDATEHNLQFEHIQSLRADFQERGLLVLSVDTKAKEMLGGICRPGSLYSFQGEALKQFDHDFPHLSAGKIVPHGIYDLGLNSGFITVGTSAETPAFVAECIGRWYHYRGKYDYPGMTEALLLMDCGGANSVRGIQFKHELLKLATRLGVTFRIAHYPPYCSKWNPIEHRLFPHVTRSIQGVYLDSPKTVSQYINERACTKTGLITRAYVLDKEFRCGLKETLPLPEGDAFIRCKTLPRLNYICHPTDYYTNTN